jgi:two-component system CheB/CheR fusion protein
MLSEPERLLLELQHRVKNLASIIRGISRRTALTSADLDEYQARFDGRLEALVRAHAAMARSARSGIDLDEIVRDTLLANALNGENWQVNGDNVRLPLVAAEMLALLFHELAIEAATAGALGDPAGRLDVHWTQHEDRLRVEWRESGLSVRAEPLAFDFAKELLEQGLPYQLKGSGSLEVAANGLICRIDLPLARLDDPR